MAFPSSPINGQTATVDGITYTYASATNSWKRQSFLVTDIVDTSATANTVILQGVNVTQNTRITVIEGVNTTQNTNITTVTGLAQAAFDKANTGVSTSTDDYARTTANTATNNITILQGVNTTQNTNITYSTNLAQAAYNQANTGGLVSNTGVITVDTFVGNGSNVAFTLSVTPVTKNYTFITFDGATQLKDSYSLSGNIITFTEAPLNGENIEVVSFTNGVITSFDTVARDIANTATNNITILQGVNTTQNTNITNATGLAQAAFDKANTGVSTSTDDYARTTSNTATNNITIIQGVNTTQNTNITYATNLAQAALDAANAITGGTHEIEYLVVGGGGAGGSYLGGGGGAGGFRTSTGLAVTSATHTITVGAGGVGGAAIARGGNGSVSVFSTTSATITSAGGGGGGGYSDPGQAGGSGGGGGYTSVSGAGNTPSTSPSQGNNGGTGPVGGGGGASAVGANGNGAGGWGQGNGGAGTASSITGASVTYAGGGGGAADIGRPAGTGGAGGGGTGEVGDNGTGSAGTVNTGGGGGARGGSNGGRNGGSGIVILRTTSLADSTTGSPTITYDGAYNIYAFTSSGSITFPSLAAAASEVIDDYARATSNTATNNITILQGVNTTQNTRMSVIEGGLITANANSAYLTSVNTTQNTNITFATSLAQAAFDKANTGTSGGSSNVTIVTSDSFVGNGSNVAFTLSVAPSSKDYTIITFDGAVQLRSSYSLAANTITFTEAPLNGENVEVTSFSSMAATTTVTINTFTGDGSTVAYTLSVSPSSKDYTFVNFDGTAQLRSSYSLSGNILTFTEAPLVGENIEVTSFTTNSTSSGTTIGKAIAMSIIFGG